MQKLAALTILPVFGWAVSAILAVFAAIPLWFLWTWLAPKFFPFVPEVWLNIGFWETAGMLVLIGFFKLILLPRFLNATVEGK